MVLFLLSFDLLAGTAKEIKEKMVKEKCLDIYGSFVVAKISDNQYRMKFKNGYSYGQAMLLTKDTKFSSKGRVGSLYVRNAGIKKMEMKDGFEKDFTIWVESKACESLGKERSVALKREHEAGEALVRKKRQQKNVRVKKEQKVKNDKKKKFNSLYE